MAQKYFRQAVNGLVEAARDGTREGRVSYPPTLISSIPHQANFRIIEAVARRLGISREHTFTNLDRYGNLSSASIPVAIAEAADGDRIRAGDRILMPAFGGRSHVVRACRSLGSSNDTPGCQRFNKLSGSDTNGT